MYGVLVASSAQNDQGRRRRMFTNHGCTMTKMAYAWMWWVAGKTSGTLSQWLTVPLASQRQLVTQSLSHTCRQVVASRSVPESQVNRSSGAHSTSQADNIPQSIGSSPWASKGCALIQKSYCRIRKIGGNRIADLATREKERDFACHLLSSAEKIILQMDGPVWQYSTLHLLFASGEHLLMSDNRAPRPTAGSQLHVKSSPSCFPHPPPLPLPRSTPPRRRPNRGYFHRRPLPRSQSSIPRPRPSPDFQGSLLATFLTSRVTCCRWKRSCCHQPLQGGPRCCSPDGTVLHRCCSLAANVLRRPDPWSKRAPRSQRPDPSPHDHLAVSPSRAVEADPYGYLPWTEYAFVATYTHDWHPSRNATTPGAGQVSASWRKRIPMHHICSPRSNG